MTDAERELLVAVADAVIAQAIVNNMRGGIRGNEKWIQVLSDAYNRAQRERDNPPEAR
jgi:hypothetical protein